METQIDACTNVDELKHYRYTIQEDGTKQTTSRIS